MTAGLLGLLALSAVPSAEARVPRKFFGAATIAAPTPTDLGEMRSTGLGSYRMPIIWRAVEPFAPTPLPTGTLHSYDFSGYDQQMRDITEAGLRAHVILIGTPSWIDKSIHTSPWQSAAGRENWPEYVEAVLERYGPDGTFWLENPDLPVNQPDAYEIWNEENSEVTYRPRANPREYARLLASAGKQIRAGDPQATIVTGGMFGTPQLDDSIYAWDFLRVLLAKKRASKYIDAIGVHPYAGMMRGLKYQMRLFVRELKRAHMKRTPIYVTELGWSSEPKTRNSILFNQGRKGQAKLTDSALKYLLKKRSKWHIKRILWFTWIDLSERDARQSGCGFCQKMGLLKEDRREKPAYRKFSKRVSKAIGQR